MKNLEKGLVIFKVLLSILAPYILFFKLHVEIMINNLNIFREMGSIYLYPLGQISLALIILELILYPIIASTFTKDNNALRALKNKLFGFDLALIFITTLVFIINISQLHFHILLKLNLLCSYMFLTVFCVLIYMITTLLTLHILRAKLRS